MLCTWLLPAWPSYWCLCCGGHLERCPASAHEHCLCPSSPYLSAWQGCQPHLQSLPGSATVSNFQFLYASSTGKNTMLWLWYTVLFMVSWDVICKKFDHQQKTYCLVNAFFFRVVSYGYSYANTLFSWTGILVDGFFDNMNSLLSVWLWSDSYSEYTVKFWLWSWFSSLSWPVQSNVWIFIWQKIT